VRRLRYHRTDPIDRNSVKVVHLTIKNRAVALLLTILIIALGVTFLTVGVALLAGLAITGAVVGTGAAIYRRLQGKSDLHSGERLSRDASLDPSLEVRPERPATIAPSKAPDK
jgi:hypothetical protein